METPVGRRRSVKDGWRCAVRGEVARCSRGPVRGRPQGEHLLGGGQERGTRGPVPTCADESGWV